MTGSALASQMEDMVQAEIALAVDDLCENFGIDPLLALAVQPVLADMLSVEERRDFMIELLQASPAGDLLDVEPVRLASWAAFVIAITVGDDESADLFHAVLEDGWEEEICDEAEGRYLEIIGALSVLSEQMIDESFEVEPALGRKLTSLAALAAGMRVQFCDEADEPDCVLVAIGSAIHFFSIAATRPVIDFIDAIGRFVDAELADDE